MCILLGVVSILIANGDVLQVWLSVILIIAELASQIAFIFVQRVSPKMISYSLPKRLVIQFFALMIICISELTWGAVTVDIGQVDYFAERYS